MTIEPNVTTERTDEATAHRYTAELARAIEERWQAWWDEHRTFEAPNPAGPLADPDAVSRLDDKLFVLDMFPYPSSAGLHVGHPLGYVGTDVFSRYQRMLGKNVLHTMGYDAFGLPAEQYAVQTGTHPAITTAEAVDTYRRQLHRLGMSYDMRRSVETTDPNYYRWTQWIFGRVFESWYDPEAPHRDGGTGRARPIAELIGEFESGARSTPDGSDWSTLTPTEQADIVDGHRLAYVASAPVNWCPGLGTVVANEEVTADGRSERGNFPVFKRNMRQWMMRITTYADRLIDDLEVLDWTDSLKTIQRNWIGRSAGAEVHFPSPAGPISVFTTRPDTLFGATFMVLAPEHPLVADLTTGDQSEEVLAYRTRATAQSDMDRQSEGRAKTGVFTGSYATNPVTGNDVPVWVADYVLMGYGTGAIMAVPCGDQRDFEFARVFGLDIPAIQQPPTEWFTERGIAPTLDTTTWPRSVRRQRPVRTVEQRRGLTRRADVGHRRHGADQCVAGSSRPGSHHHHLQAARLALQPPAVLGRAVPDRLRRRRSPASAPRPSVAVDAAGHRQLLAPHLRPRRRVLRTREPVGSVDRLGRRHPRSGRRTAALSPRHQRDAELGRIVLVRTALPRSDQRAGLRRPRGRAVLDGAAPEIRPDHPGGVDLYVGGVEHAVLHLLYARFWHKVLYDLGYLSSKEPFAKLYNQGYVLAAAYLDERGAYVEAREVVAEPGGTFSHGGRPVTREWGKMGKSLKNSVSPEEIYDAYGADTLRLHLMATGPLDASRPWETRDVVGMYRFLQRLWRNVIDESTGAARVSEAPAPDELRRRLHQTIDVVRTEIEALRFNTAIAKVIELNNVVTKAAADGSATPREVAEGMVLMVSPFAPHAGEDLWRRLGHDESIAFAPFPVADPALLVEDTVEYPVQVNGKVRGHITVSADAPAADVEAAALADARVQTSLAGTTPKKVIVVPGRMVNIVA